MVGFSSDRYASVTTRTELVGDEWTPTAELNWDSSLLKHFGALGGPPLEVLTARPGRVNAKQNSTCRLHTSAWIS